MLTHERLKEVLSYDRDTGLFHWRVATAHRITVGDIAGAIGHYGYRIIGIDGKSYRANRLAWFYMTGSWPIAEIDHEDTDRSNDAFRNLREATESQNAANGKLRSTNTSGLKGVSWDKEKRKWVAGIKIDYKRKMLGRFDKKEDAHKAYLIAAEKLFGQFARAA
jgi:hypothetical protein